MEPQKRREYEAWFKNQEKEAMEYSASVKYQEKGSEMKEMTTTTTQNHFQQQQHQQQQLVHTNHIQGMKLNHKQSLANGKQPMSVLVVHKVQLPVEKLNN